MLSGKLYIVGVGPGHHDHMTFRAKQVIEESDTIVGYETYVNLVKDLINGKDVYRYAMTQEVDRESLSRSWSAALDDPFLVFLVAIAFASAFFLRAFAWKTIIPRLSF